MNAELYRKNYKFGMDWLNGILPITDVWGLFDQLKQFSSKLEFERWELVNSGKYNYSRRYCLNGKFSFQIMYNPVSLEEAFTACCADKFVIDSKHPYSSTLAQYHSELLKSGHKTNNNGFIFISISGDGIRELSKMGGAVSALNKLLFYFFRNGFRASRFDPYCDILDKNNTAVPLIQKAFKYFKQPRVGYPTLRTNVQRKDGNILMPRYVDDKGKVYYNCTLGNHGTRFGMFRCYNKRMELLEGRLSEFSSDMLKEYDVKDYWWRLEYEMHKENAAACFNSCMAEAEKNNHVISFENVFASCLERVFAIVDVSSLGRGLDSYNYADNWASFCNLILDNAIHLVQFNSVPYIPMSKARLHSYIRKNSVFVFSLLVALFLSRPLMLEVVHSGAEKYFKKKKYNELRDEQSVPPWMESFVRSQMNRSINAFDNWVA